MSFSKEFINEFVENGLELFLFHTEKEKEENQNATDAILKSNQQQYIHVNLQDLRTKILYYNNLYPLVIYFTYEPRKNFYIAKKICEIANDFTILPNLYEDDSSVNCVAGFSVDKQFEFESLWQLIIFHGLTTGIIGYKIYGVDIVNIYDTCRYEGTHLTVRHNPFSHFCGDSIRRDKPYKIVQARHITEQILSKRDFKNELDLLLSLSDYIMKPIQQQYIKMGKYIDSLKLQNLYDKKIINDYCNQIYALLVKDKVVPTKWKHEYQMFELIISVYQDARYQYYADWVSPQNYDVLDSLY